MEDCYDFIYEEEVPNTVKAPLTDSSYERTALSNGQFFGHRFNSYKFVKKVISIVHRDD
jgi:hypothetical protein